MPLMALSVGAIALGAILLFLSITGLLRVLRESEVVRLPAKAEQAVTFKEAGSYVLHVSSPRLNAALRSASFALRSSGGQDVPSSPSVFRTTVSGVSSVRMSVRNFELVQPGSYRLIVTGYDHTADVSKVELIITRPFAGAMVLRILGIIAGAAMLIGGVVFTALPEGREVVIARDPRLQSLAWRDLVSLRPLEVARELTLSLPWLAASLALAYAGIYPVGLACSFMFFLTGLRQVHNAFHYALGVPRAATEWAMFALSVLMLGSMHAVQVNHLRHHRYCLAEGDVEAMSARLPAWRAILIGPWFPLRLHHAALKFGDVRQRRWIWMELAANAAWIALVFGAIRMPALEYHVMAMALGQCLTAFFAVWTVHHDTESQDVPARTIRGPVKARLTYSMFYHVEHHLFPAVPTCHLRHLAQRLDEAAPELARHQVF